MHKLNLEYSLLSAIQRSLDLELIVRDMPVLWQY